MAEESLTIADLNHLKEVKEAYQKGIPIEVLMQDGTKQWVKLPSPMWNAHPRSYRIKPIQEVKYTTIQIGE